MVKAAEADAPVPAVTPSTPTPTTYRLPSSAVPGIFAKLRHYQYQHATATHVSDIQTSANMVSLHVAYWSTVDSRLAHMR